MKTLIKLMSVFLAVLYGQVAAAQEWTVGPVTPTWSKTVQWTPPIPPEDPHPADAYEPEVSEHDNDIYTRESWISSSNQRINIGTAGEAKFRTEAKPSFIKRADPILCRDVYPCLHGHTFFGSNDPYIIENVQSFDYDMGRAHPSSAAQGGPLNGTLYWEPSIYVERYGLTLTVIPKNATFYYTLDPDHGQMATRLRRNINFIGGANPADFNDTARRAEYAAIALEYPGTPETPPGFGGVTCYLLADPNGNSPVPIVGDEHKMKTRLGDPSTNGAARYVKGPNGEDPWDGGCQAGYINIQVGAPNCWDGVNLHSPNGRDHFRYSTRDGDNNPGPGHCPSNFAMVPSFQTKVFVVHNGWEEDLQHWYLSSDRMRVATVECPDPAAPCDGVSGGNVPATVDGVYYSRESKDPCRATGVDFCPFATAHFDWWGAWDNQSIEEWQKNCVGMVIGETDGDHADCGSGGLDTNRTLLSGGTPPEAGLASDPVNSVDSLVRASSSTEGQRYFPINAADEVQGPLEVHVHH